MVVMYLVMVEAAKRLLPVVQRGAQDAETTARAVLGGWSSTDG